MRGRRGLTDAEFRRELGDWLSGVARPAGLRDYGATPASGDIESAKLWQRILFDAGWAGLSWPVQYGGEDCTPSQLAIFAEVMAEAKVPRQLNIVSLDLAAPMIMAFGTQEQKSRHLSAILSGDEVWCQLFSEPDAGSDLASISCRAEATSDAWKVSGQKLWTSGAHYADYGLLLARTDSDSERHRGLSCFLVPMQREGITARPLVQMDGDAKFNEVFLDGVRVEPSDLLGEIGEGWKVAMSTLGRERLSLGAQAVGLLDMLEELSAAMPTRLENPVVRMSWVSLWCRVRLLRLTWLRGVGTSGPAPESAVGVLKLLASELQRDVTRFAVDMLGMSAQGGDEFEVFGRRFLAAPGATLAGGTSEIQRNIQAERILGMPREPH